jgi:membrane-associated phospholipid phosphatase
LFEDRRFADTILNWMFNKPVWTLMWSYLYVNIGHMMCCYHFHIHKFSTFLKDLLAVFMLLVPSAFLMSVSLSILRRMNCWWFLSLLWISALWSVVLMKVGNVPQSLQVNI